MHRPRTVFAVELNSYSGDIHMVKLVVGFVIFAAVSLFVIMKAGDKVDMSGEKHGTETVSPGASGTH